MRRRDAALGEMVTRLDGVLPELAQGLGLASLGLRARFGGHQANYSPTAWVRVYAPDYSPRAMEGFYIVYLFATDGSAVYLSLNQGTSEFRSNAMRPVNDRAELRARAAEARRLLSDFEGTPLMTSATVAMDLTWASTPGVGPESRRRTRNYEDANIIALRYPAGSIPPDEELLQDLRTCSHCWRLYISSRKIRHQQKPHRTMAPKLALRASLSAPVSVSGITSSIRQSALPLRSSPRMRRSGHSAPTGTSNGSGTCTSVTTSIAVTGRPAAFCTSR